MTTTAIAQSSSSHWGRAGEVIGVIQNILYRRDINHVAAGDLFLEPSQLTYIAYVAGISPAPVAVGAAALMGGLVGVLAQTNALSDKKGFLKNCDRPRILDWGLPVSERASRKGRYVITIPRSEIDAFETDGGIAVRTATTTHTFGCAFKEDSSEAARMFRSWMAQELSKNESVERFGLHRSFSIGPQELIQAIVQKEAVPPSFLEEASMDKAYMKSFFEGLALVHATKLGVLLDTFRSAPEGFRACFHDFLKGRAKGGERVPLSVWPWGAASIVSLLLSVSLLDKVPFAPVCLIVSAGGFIGTIADWWRGPRRYLAATRYFEDNDQRAAVEANNRGIALKSAGDFNGAIHAYSEAIRLDPRLPEGFRNRGNAHFEKGDLDAAAADFTEALRLQQDDADTYYNRGMVWKAKHDVASSVRDFQKYLELGGGERSGDTQEVLELISDLQRPANG